MKNLIIFLILFCSMSSCNQQVFAQFDQSINNTELVPLDPDSLNSVEGIGDRWRRRPRNPNPPDFNPPDFNPPNRERPIVDNPERERFPRLKRFANWIWNRPIFMEIRELISSVMMYLIIFAVWFLPVYLLRWRFVWPIDIVTTAFDKMKELSQNTKKPFESKDDR